jgi:hypothetical protein
MLSSEAASTQVRYMTSTGSRPATSVFATSIAVMQPAEAPPMASIRRCPDGLVEHGRTRGDCPGLWIQCDGVSTSGP